MNRIFPLLGDLKTYSWSLFRGDFLAAVTVSFILIPQAIAYSYLAGVPPIYGLFAGLLPLIVYGFLGTSRQLSIGPVAITSILLLSGLSKIATPFSIEYIQYALLAGILIGIVQLLIGITRMGFLVNFLSNPVVSGFISGAAVIIIVSQLKDIFGISIQRQSSSALYIKEIITNIKDSQLTSIAYAAVSMLVLVYVPKLSKKIPTALIVVVIGTIISAVFNLNETGLKVVGEIPKGLPSFHLPIFDLDIMIKLIPTVLTVSLIGIVECISIAKSVELKLNKDQLNPDQELIAIGSSKILGGFFQAMPSSASFSRTAIAVDTGAKSGIASIITGLSIGVTLLFFTQLLFHLPIVVLASIIVVSVFKLIEWKEFKRLWKLNKIEFATILTTFLATITLGVEIGVLIGVLFSVLNILYESSQPHVAELGKLPDSNHFRNVERFDYAKLDSRMIILRFDDQLYFGNAAYFKDSIYKALKSKDNYPQYFILDLSNAHRLDSTGLRALVDIHTYLKNREIELLLASCIGPVRDFIKKGGFTDTLGRDHFFLNIQEAAKYIDHPETFIHSSEAWKGLDEKKD